MASWWGKVSSLFKSKKAKELEQVHEFIIEVGRAHMRTGRATAS
jgi:hypothetical protein